MSPFIDGARLQQANAKAKERSQFSDKLPIFPVGPHRVTLTRVKALVNEKTGTTEVHVEVTDPNGAFRSITEVLRIKPAQGEELKEYHDINLQILSNYFLAAFGYEMQNAETLAGFVKQFTQFLNREIQIVVQHQQRVMKPENPNDKMILFEEAHIWYTGDITKDVLSFKIAEATRPLSAKEQALWNDWKGPKGLAKGVEPVGTTAVSSSVKAAAQKPVSGPQPDFADAGTAEAEEATTQEEEGEVEGDVQFE